MRRLMAISFLACLADAEIGGWTVSAKPDSNGTCLAARAYDDKDDDNKKNSVVFGLIKDKAVTQMVMVLGYEGWNFDKGEAVVGDLIIDGKTIYKKWKWEGDGKVLTAVFNDTGTVVPVVGAAKKIVLHFGTDGEANFLIPNAGLALGAVQLCLG